MKYMQFLTPIYPENGYYSLTDEQIKQFEAEHNIRLPEIMHEFYRLAGRGYGKIFEVDYDTLDSAKEILEMITDDPELPYYQVVNPNEIFPIGEYGGNIYFVYRKDFPSENPPVYIYTILGAKSRNIPPKSIGLLANTFLEWIEGGFNELKESPYYHIYVRE